MDIVSRPTAFRKGLAIVATTVLALLLQVWRLRRRRARGCPRWEGHWFFGWLPAFAKAASEKRQNEYILDLHRKLGLTIACSAVKWESVMTMDPRNVKHILKTNFDNYPKGADFQNIFQDLLGKGIFNADGHEWFAQRKTTSQMFTAKLFKEHIWHVVRRNARNVRDILQSTEPGRVVDMFSLMNRFTLDTIGEIGFGKTIGSLEDPSSPFLKSFDIAQQICFTRTFFPIWKLTRFLGCGFESGTREHFGLLDTYSRSVVRDLQKNMERDGASGVAWADLEARKSFLGLFLEDAKKQGVQLDESYLRDLVLNFLIAGRDTTAQALSWTFFCLATNPEVEAKARAEILDVCDERGPSYDDMNQLPYLQAVLSEALRLYPSVPLDIKRASCDDTWPDGTMVRAGTMVIYNIFGMGRNKETWGDDAETFRPERWLERKEVPDVYDQPVFNAGPRECLGKRLAQVEMKACLATLLPHISLTLAVPADQIKGDAQVTIGMSSGLPMFVTSVSKQDDRASEASTGAPSGESLPSED